MNRVAEFVVAIATAIAEFSSAMSTITHAPPQYLWPRTNAGSSDELGSFADVVDAPARDLPPRHEDEQERPG